MMFWKSPYFLDSLSITGNCMVLDEQLKEKNVKITIDLQIMFAFY